MKKKIFVLVLLLTRRELGARFFFCQSSNAKQLLFDTQLKTALNRGTNVVILFVVFCVATPVHLRHLTKNRVGQPAVKRRRPTRAKLREMAIQR